MFAQRTGRCWGQHPSAAAAALLVGVQLLSLMVLGPSFCVLEGFGSALIFSMDLGVAALVVQWLRLYLPVQGTWVRSLVQEDPTCQGATKLLCLDPTLCNKRSPCSEKPMPHG